MCATIHKVCTVCTILLLLLPITRTTITQSSEPVLDVECFHDYEDEMTCSLMSTELNCSEYKLDVFRETEHLFMCSLEQISSSVCNCKSQVSSGFIVRENLMVKVLSGEKTLFTSDFTTEDIIKPKRPVITSVKQTKNENFYITWKTDYQGALFEELTPELTYSITGSNTNETKPLGKGLTSYEIVGRNLQPNTNYTVWARVKCALNQKFSDYSEPYMFKTPSSIQDILRIIIPVLCILLIICISTMFYCYHKILSEWWDKVPTPKIAANIVKQVPNLLSFQNEFSPVHLDSSKPDRIGEKIWIGSSQFDIISQNSLQSLGKDGDSSQVIYAQTGYECVDGNSSKNDSQCEFEDEYHSTDLPQTVMSSRMYKHLQPKTIDFGVQNERKKCSDIENKTYIKTLTDHFNQRNVFFPALFKNLNPQIETDFGYGPCTGCLESTNTGSTPVHNTPFVTQTTLVPGYQSVTEVMDCGNKSASDASVGQTFLHSREDVDLIMKKLMCNKKPQDVLFTAWETIPVESEYKDVQSLCMNTEGQHSAEVKSSLQIFPGIEMDCSYHRV